MSQGADHRIAVSWSVALPFAFNVPAKRLNDITSIDYLWPKNRSINSFSQISDKFLPHLSHHTINPKLDRQFTTFSKKKSQDTLTVAHVVCILCDVFIHLLFVTLRINNRLHGSNSTTRKIFKHLTACASQNNAIAMAYEMAIHPSVRRSGQFFCGGEGGSRILKKILGGMPPWSVFISMWIQCEDRYSLIITSRLY